MKYDYDVFISYAHEDTNDAMSLEDTLCAAKLKVYIDKTSLGAGDRWRESLHKGIKQSRYFIPLLSSISTSKEGFVKTEFEYAIQLLKEGRGYAAPYILPVRISPCDIPAEFLDFNCVDLCDNDKKDKAIASIVSTLKSGELFDSSWVIGFDIGHGDSSFSFAQVHDHNYLSATINGKTSIPTAINLTADNETLIGYEAFAKDGAVIHFKNPTEIAKNKDNLHLFIKTVFKRSDDLKEISGKPNYMYFGCPTGWTQEQRREYKEALTDILPSTLRVNVISEARAALAYVKEIGEMKEYKDKLPAILVIDIGSSTTDIAYMEHLRAIPYETGSISLGCSLIDKATYMVKVNANVKDLEHRSGLLNFLYDNDKGKKIADCLFRCRLAKEDFFNRAEGMGDIVPKALYSIEMLDPYSEEGNSIKIQITDKEDMDKILKMRIPELNDKSWPEAFEDDLKELLMKMQEEGNKVPDIIILVGGGARMQFVKEIASRIFNSSKIIRPAECHLAVSKGLTLCGLMDMRMEEMLENMQLYFNEGEIKKIIEKDMPMLAERLASHIDTLSINVVVETLNEWKKEEYTTLGDLDKRIENRIRASVTHNTDINAMLDAWKKDKYALIQEKVVSYCKRYGIPANEIPQLTGGELPGGDFDTPISKHLKVGIEQLIATIPGVVIWVLAGTGPYGWFLGALIAVVAFVTTKILAEEFLRSYMESWELPSWLRKILAKPDDVQMELKNTRYSRIEKLQSEILETFRMNLGQGKISKSIANDIQKEAKNIEKNIRGEELPI